MNLTTEEVKKFREFGYINKLIFKDSECEFLKNHFGNLIKNTLKCLLTINQMIEL